MEGGPLHINDLKGALGLLGQLQLVKGQIKIGPFSDITKGKNLSVLIPTRPF